MFGKSSTKVGDIIEPLLDEERFAEREMLARITVPPQVKSSALASSVPPPAPETSSSISLMEDELQASSPSTAFFTESVATFETV